METGLQQEPRRRSRLRPKVPNIVQNVSIPVGTLKNSGPSPAVVLARFAADDRFLLKIDERNIDGVAVPVVKTGNGLVRLEEVELADRYKDLDEWKFRMRVNEDMRTKQAERHKALGLLSSS